MFTEKGDESIHEIAAHEHCKTRGLETHTQLVMMNILYCQYKIINGW